MRKDDVDPHCTDRKGERSNAYQFLSSRWRGNLVTYKGYIHFWSSCKYDTLENDCELGNAIELLYSDLFDLPATCIPLSSSRGEIIITCFFFLKHLTMENLRIA